MLTAFGSFCVSVIVMAIIFSKKNGLTSHKWLFVGVWLGLYSIIIILFYDYLVRMVGSLLPPGGIVVGVAAVTAIALMILAGLITAISKPKERRRQ